MDLAFVSNGVRAFIFAAVAWGVSVAAKGNELDRVYDFLEKNAVNRTLLMEDKGTLAEGTVGYVFRREATLCNLTRSVGGFRYDVVYRITQENWDIKDGQRKGESRTEDRIMVARFECGFRESTGEVTGYVQMLTSTRPKWDGGTYLVRMRRDGDRLEVNFETAHYHDHFGPGGSTYPGADVNKESWFLVDGKLVRETKSKAYRVDPETMKRELIDDRKPVVEKEIARLPLG